MKKIFAIAIILVSCVALASCENKTVKETVEKIDDIAVVTLDSRDAICEAEQLYKQLSDSDKEKVTNYFALQAAREAYNLLVVTEVTNQFFVNDYEGIAECLSNADEQAVENASPVVEDNICSYLETVDILREPKEQIDSMLKLVEAVSFSSAEKKSDIEGVLEGMQSFQDRNGKYIDFLNMFDTYDDQVAEAVETHNQAIESSSMYLMTDACAKIKFVADRVTYKGNEEYAIKYAQSVSEISDGMSMQLEGIVTRDDSLMRKGIEKIINGNESYIECIEFAGSIKVEALALLEIVESKILNT